MSVDPLWPPALAQFWPEVALRGRLSKWILHVNFTARTTGAHRHRLLRELDRQEDDERRHQPEHDERDERAHLRLARLRMWREMREFSLATFRSEPCLSALPVILATTTSSSPRATNSLEQLRQTIRLPRANSGALDEQTLQERPSNWGGILTR